MQLRSGYTTGVPPGLLPEPTKSAFEEGIFLVMSKWTALMLAVENQWGGASSKEKADDLKQEIIEWFYKKRGRYFPRMRTIVGRVGTLVTPLIASAHHELITPAATACDPWQSTMRTIWSSYLMRLSHMTSMSSAKMDPRSR